MYETIMAILQALSAWFKYQFDPEMVKRRDEINKQQAENNDYDSVDKLLAGKKALDLAYFISESLRRMRLPQSDTATGRAADLLLGILPKPRDQKNRDADHNEGLSG